MHARVVLGAGKGALFRELSSVQGSGTKQSPLQFSEIEKHARVVLGVGRGVLSSGV